MLNTQALLDALDTQGWYYQQNALDENTIKLLQQECSSRVMKSAGIGQTKAINTEIRSDMISWLEPEENTPALASYLDLMNSLRKSLNQTFYLGLKSHEAHFARYEKGCFYKPHKDSFSKENKRAITFILYLNENWTQADGGELRLHLSEDKTDIKPVAGSVICFVSDEIEHEVLLSHKRRLSLTAWFLR